MARKKHRDPRLFLRRLWALEALLVKAGFPAMPAWWRETLTRFYLSGKRRLVVRKGRRVFASTCVAPRLAVAEMLWGSHQHLAGTPPILFAFLSVKRAEAAQRLRGVKAILEALGEPYREKGDTIELENRPAVFSVVTANFRTSVGETVGFAWCDEVSRWLDDDTGANPAEQVIGSLSPALATLPDAKLFLVSSPLTRDDFHAKAFDRGETEAQCVAFGTTWEINPTLSEADTHTLEPDERIWAREYAARPADAVTENVFGPVLDACIDQDRKESPPAAGRYYIGAVDAASGKGGGDKFAIAVSHRERRKRHVLTILDCIRSWRAPRGQALSIASVVGDSAAVFLPYDAHVFADQWAFAPLRELYLQHRVTLNERTWTVTSKSQMTRRVYVGMAQQLVRIPNVPSLIAEFRSLTSTLLPGGGERIEGRGTDDEAHAAIMALAISMEREPDYTPADAPAEPEPGTPEAARLERERDYEARLDARIARMSRQEEILSDIYSPAALELERRKGWLQ